MSTVIERIKNEPALIAELVRSVLLLGVVFGLSITEEQIAAILLVIGAASAMFVRQTVVPSRRVETKKPL